MICIVNKPGKKNLLWRTIRIVAVIGGLYGGWLLAGALNDHRIDIPRPIPKPLVPTSQPTTYP
jgi:hypothetical protein